MVTGAAQLVNQRDDTLLRALLDGGKNEHIRMRIASLSTDGRVSERISSERSPSAELASFLGTLEGRWESGWVRGLLLAP